MGVVKNPILLKLIGAQRYLIWNTPVKVFNHIRIAEFPKSGGTWLGLMLSDLTGYSFRRSTWMTFGKGIQHSHLPWTPNGGKTILLIRDGRDVVVSAYYHFLFAHEKNPLSLVNHWRSLMAKEGVTDIEDIENNLAVFIRLFFEKFTVGGRSINWASHTRSFDLSSSDIHLIKYENLLTDAEKELQKTLNFLEMTPDHSIAKVVEKYSFQNMTEREPGQEDKSSFLRKGIAGDWKNHFTDESLEVFYSYAREQMERLGYL